MDRGVDRGVDRGCDRGVLLPAEPPRPASLSAGAREGVPGGTTRGKRPLLARAPGPCAPMRSPLAPLVLLPSGSSAPPFSLMRGYFLLCADSSPQTLFLCSLRTSVALIN